MDSTEEEIIDLSDLYTRPTEEAIAILVHELGFLEDEAGLLVRIAKGEIAGHLEEVTDEEGLGDVDWTGESGITPRWMETTSAR